MTGDFLSKFVGDVGRQEILLQLARPLDVRRAHRSIELLVQPSATALKSGVVLPVEVIIQAPSARFFERRIFERSFPSALSFTPRQGGKFLITVAECGHNFFWGSLAFDVTGDREEDL